MSEKTYKVVCTLPNASTVINDVPFELIDGHMVATGVDEQHADFFKRIDGYRVVGEGDPIPGPDRSEQDPRDNGLGGATGANQTAGSETQTQTGSETQTGTEKPLEDMTVGEIEALLADHPAAWREVEDAEHKREKPRTGVHNAVQTAKAKAEENDQA